jgi:hypothetical protein
LILPRAAGAARGESAIAMTRAYLNRVAVAVPDHEVHATFVGFAERLIRDRRSRLLFERMAARSQIERRWSCLAPAAPGCNESVDADGFYTLGRFPSTAERMRRYEGEAPRLAAAAVDRLGLGERSDFVEPEGRLRSCERAMAYGFGEIEIGRCTGG